MRVIALVEEYCSHRESQSRQTIEAQIYNKIKKCLFKELVLSHRSESESNDYIALIINSLKDTNPYAITCDKFQKTPLFREAIEDSSEQNVSNRWNFGSDLF